jgi:hypothetical protein
MPTRTVTCGECGASKAVPDGDWSSVQQPLIEAWEQQHERNDHQGNEVSAWQLAPNPMRDR